MKSPPKSFPLSIAGVPMNDRAWPERLVASQHDAQPFHRTDTQRRGTMSRSVKGGAAVVCRSCQTLAVTSRSPQPASTVQDCEHRALIAALLDAAPPQSDNCPCQVTSPASQTEPKSSGQPFGLPASQCPYASSEHQQAWRSLIRAACFSSCSPQSCRFSFSSGLEVCSGKLPIGCSSP